MIWPTSGGCLADRHTLHRAAEPLSQQVVRERLPHHIMPL